LLNNISESMSSKSIRTEKESKSLQFMMFQHHYSFLRPFQVNFCLIYKN
jgi:hypothetical protein